MVKPDEAYCQPCVSPIWDTGLASHALLETGDAEARQRVTRALAWLTPQADARCARRLDRASGPDVRPGGWAFQYANPHYPDVDDTAVVAMAMDRAQALDAKIDHRGAIDRAGSGSSGCRARTARWGAFDADNEYYYLNNIPFADHGALLDPPTEDVTARCISMLAQLGETAGKLQGGRSRRRLPPAHAACRRKLVRPLGHELHLRHLVGAVRAERRGRQARRSDDAKGRGLAARRSRMRTAAGARTARATSSITGVMKSRRARRRRPPGRCSG